MPTSKKDITVPQTGHYRMIVTVYGGPSSLSGFTGDMDIRHTKAGTPAITKVPGECFTVDDVNRQLVLDLPSSVTELYDWSGKAVYDLYLVGSDDDRWRLVEGVISLSKTVTRDEA